MNRSIAGATILVVEDREDVQAIAVAILSRLGCKVLVAATAVAALASLEKQSIDAVFADVRLPGAMSGIDLARELRLHWPEVAVLLTSGDPGPGDVRKDANAEQIPIIGKPYRATQLGEALLRAINSIQTSPGQIPISSPGRAGA